MQISQALKILEDHNLPSNIVKHSLLVTKICAYLADQYENVNKNNLLCAAILHDLFKLSDKDHSKEIYNYLNDISEHKIAEIAYKHDFSAIIDPERKPNMLEEKILNYADKRVQHDKIVTLKERLQGFKARYNPDNEDQEWVIEAQKSYFRLEKELFKHLSISPEDIKEENLKDF